MADDDDDIAARTTAVDARPGRPDRGPRRRHARGRGGGRGGRGERRSRRRTPRRPSEADEERGRQAAARDRRPARPLDAHPGRLRQLPQARRARARGDPQRYALAEPLRDFLEVVDNLDLALAAGGSADDLKRGVEMILRQMHGPAAPPSASRRSRRSAQPFDPALHEAVAREEDPTVDGADRGRRAAARLPAPRPAAAAGHGQGGGAVGDGRRSTEAAERSPASDVRCRRSRSDERCSVSKILGIDLGTTNSCVAGRRGDRAAGARQPRGQPHHAVDRRLHRGRRPPGRPDRQAPGDHQPAEHGLRRQAPDRPQVRRSGRSRAPASVLPYTLVDGRQRRRQGRRSATAQYSPEEISAFDPARDQGVRRGGPGRADHRGGHHRAGLLQRLAAPGHQGRRQDRRPRGAAHHQRAHRRGARLRPRPRRADQDHRGLRPRRRHLRHLDPRALARGSSRCAPPPATPTSAARTSTSGSWTG